MPMNLTCRIPLPKDAEDACVIADAIHPIMFQVLHLYRLLGFFYHRSTNIAPADTTLAARQK